MKIKKVSKDQVALLITQKIEALYGKADPAIVKKLSEILNREIDPAKDTEDYNMDLISELVDKHVKSLMEAGAAEVKSGDVLRLDARSQGQDSAEDMQSSINEEKYALYPFNHALEKEMRSYFLLRTQKKDSFKDLIQEFYTLAPKFMTTGEVEILKRVIKKAEARIFKEDLRFLNPPEGQEQGTLKTMDDFEKKALGMEGERVTVDERKDNHDLLALKEMVLLMRGSDVHPLSIGPGFFSKYMPELGEEGFLGVVTEVESQKLSKIYLLTLPGEKDFKDKGYEAIVFGFKEYSPLMASALLFYNLQSSMVKTPQKIGNKTVDMGFHQVNEKLLDRPVRYYVTVDGIVSGPTSKGPLNYESAAKNDMRIPAAETFLIEKEEEQIMHTRIYFQAYKPSQLHPMLQHGSLVYGVNDMSFHSCTRSLTPEGDVIVSEEYKEFMKNRYDNGKEYQPGDIASQLHHFPKRSDGTSSVPTDMFLKENERAMLDNANGMFDHNGEFLTWRILKWLPMCNLAYISGNALFCLREMTANAYPLTHRWLISKYMKDQKGTTKNPQMTFYRQLVQVVEENALKDILKLNASIVGARKKTKDKE